jgi:hypothetical protein
LTGTDFRSWLDWPDDRPLLTAEDIVVEMNKRR